MKFKAGVALLLVMGSSFGLACEAGTHPVAGKNYIEIEDGRPMQPAENQVVVEEFFNYVCPACNRFEPLFLQWQSELPSYARIVHIPANFRPDFEVYARAYLAAEALGLADKSHQAVYDAIHRERSLPAEGDVPDEQAVAEFYSGFGVSADKFLDAMHGFAVELKLRQAGQHLRRSKIPSTPSILVDGRYLVKGTSYEDMLRTTRYLIEKVHAEQVQGEE